MWSELALNNHKQGPPSKQSSFLPDLALIYMQNVSGK